MSHRPCYLPFLLFVLAYYSDVAMPGSATDQTRIWTIALTEYVFMAGAVFIVNAKDGVCSTYYSVNLRFDHTSGGGDVYCKCQGRSLLDLLYRELPA